MEVDKLDREKLGNLLIGALFGSVQAGHKRVEYTLQHYIDTRDDLEKQFLKDIFTLRTDELAEKWCGGAMNVKVRIMQAIEGQKD
jgi:hypothetical protein